MAKSKGGVEMISLHWNVIVFVLVLIVGVGYLISGDEDHGGYLPDLGKPLCFIGLIIYTLIWGGVFWW